jgi:hypothetical protein
LIFFIFFYLKLITFAGVCENTGKSFFVPCAMSCPKILIWKL